MRYIIICFLLIPLCATAQEQYVAGVLRNTGDGWYVLNDATHEPLNIASVSNDARSITIAYGRQFSTIRTFLITADETYAVRHGLVCGVMNMASPPPTSQA